MHRNCLHLATKFHLSDEVIAYVLVKTPGAVLSQDYFNRLPLHYAISNIASVDMVKKLIATHPITVRAGDDIGWTPLHVACSHSPSLDIVKFILGSFPEGIVLKTNKGLTPVGCARQNTSDDRALILHYLIEEERKFVNLPLFENMKNAEMRDLKWTKRYRSIQVLQDSTHLNQDYKPRGDFV